VDQGRRYKETAQQNKQEFFQFHFAIVVGNAISRKRKCSAQIQISKIFEEVCG
jgi:hypothetical protein